MSQITLEESEYIKKIIDRIGLHNFLLEVAIIATPQFVSYPDGMGGVIGECNDSMSAIEMLFDHKPKPALPKWGWTVRVIGKGSDKSDYWVVRVHEMPGFTGSEVHYGKPYWPKVDCSRSQILNRAQQRWIEQTYRSFTRQHPIFRYREEARTLKKTLVQGKSNVNSWRNQSDSEYESWV